MASSLPAPLLEQQNLEYTDDSPNVPTVVPVSSSTTDSHLSLVSISERVVLQDKNNYNEALLELRDAVHADLESNHASATHKKLEEARLKAESFYRILVQHIQEKKIPNIHIEDIPKVESVVAGLRSWVFWDDRGLTRISSKTPMTNTRPNNQRKSSEVISDDEFDEDGNVSESPPKPIQSSWGGFAPVSTSSTTTNTTNTTTPIQPKRESARAKSNPRSMHTVDMEEKTGYDANANRTIDAGAQGQVNRSRTIVRHLLNEFFGSSRLRMCPSCSSI